MFAVVVLGLIGLVERECAQAVVGVICLVVGITFISLFAMVGLENVVM